MDIFYTIFYEIVRIGTYIRCWFKPANDQHFIEKATLINDKYETLDITYLIDKYNFTDQIYKQLSIPLSFNPTFIDLEYHFNGLKYNTIYNIEDIESFPLYALDNESITPPSNLLSVQLGDKDITEIIKKYEGPYVDFHNSSTKLVDFRTIFVLNNIEYIDEEIEIMTSDLDIKLCQIDSSIGN